MTQLSSLSKISFGKILNDKNFIYLSIIIITIFLIGYNLLTSHTKYLIHYWITQPLVLIPIIIIIIIIGKINIWISLYLITALSLVILSFPNFSIFKNNNNTLETFTEKSDNNEDNKDNEDDEDDEDPKEKERKKKEANQQYYINGIKSIFTSKLKDTEKYQNSELQKGIIENKKKILNRVKKINQKNKNNITEKNSQDKIIKKRLFNPNKEEDTNMLITKEILLDMSNRIDYDYENMKYLKRYLRSRIEEIIETNNLLDEEL